MKCLHGEPCAQSTTEKGTFWFCNQNPSCNLICLEIYKEPQPHCEKHGKLAKIRVVKNLLKTNYGRPFFVCSEQRNLCFFWAWGDVQPIAKPKCRHGSQCAVRKVKKETVNKDRLFFCCGQEDSCNYFEWVPEESYSHTKFLPSTTSDFFLNGFSPSYF